MNGSQADAFLRRVMVAYPGLGQWVREYSPEPRETFAIWKAGLEDVSPEEANRVLDGWIAGTFTDAPVGFERERIVANIKNHVRAFRADSRRQQIARETHETIGRRAGEPSRLPGSAAIFESIKRKMAETPSVKPSDIANLIYSEATHGV